MMTSYSLTDRERDIIVEYLTTEKKLQDFRVLVHRIKKLDIEQLHNDLDLIKQFLTKIDQK